MTVRSSDCLSLSKCPKEAQSDEKTPGIEYDVNGLGVEDFSCSTWSLLVYVQPIVNAFYCVVSYLSHPYAPHPREDPKIEERVVSLFVRLLLFLWLLPFPLPTDDHPLSSFGLIRYPLLLFAIANTRENCGDMLPMYHSILAVAIASCSFLGSLSSWAAVTTETVTFFFIGIAQFALAATFRNRSEDLVVCGLRLMKSRPRGYYGRPQTDSENPPCIPDETTSPVPRILYWIMGSLSPSDSLPPNEDPNLAYRVFSLCIRLGLLAFLVCAPTFAAPAVSDLAGWCRYPLLVLTAWLRQVREKRTHAIHRAAPFYHSLLAIAIPWSYHAASCGGQNGMAEPPEPICVAPLYGFAAFSLAITFRSRVDSISLFFLEMA
ncbi:hypothetical protein MKEN_01155600 [Mycena kentingensis (nom. inval.)]|nr:hypothetical protein MKEN_01155600 [Mycena kentingensis (nom. inval.)]